MTTSMRVVRALLLLWAAAAAMWSQAPDAAGQGLRVVDLVRVGEPSSDLEHEFAGRDCPRLVDRGRSFRVVSGWVSYSLRVYDDTALTLECAFLGDGGPDPAFELLVEGRLVSRRAPALRTPGIVTSRVPVPFEITRGLTAVRVTLRYSGGPGPRLHQVRSVQEHLELADDAF